MHELINAHAMQCYVYKTCTYYTNSSLAAIQLRFAPQNYTVTEGGAVNITLEAVPPSGGYDFDFTVTLQYMNESATGECVQVHMCKSKDCSSFEHAI